MKATTKSKSFVLFIATALTAALFALSVAFGAAGVTAESVAGAKANDNMVTYEIYPNPHSIVYGDSFVDITDDVFVSAGENIDKPTRDRLFDALSKIDVCALFSPKADATKVMIGVYGSGDDADRFIAGKSIASSHFEKIDAHVLYIGADGVAIVGKNTDAAFYGVATLDMILSQSGRKVRALTVVDYSDSVYRGFIEGYYGTPWTTDERIELMKFGSMFKTNIYVYAPKDDPYHSRNWRGLYTGADYAALKEQIDAGNATKTRFTWSVHPLMENSKPFKRENYDADIAVLLAKFQQIYDAGCRSFMVSADDINGDKVDGACQRDMLNDVQKWLDKKGDCYELIFVSSSYCDASQEALGVNQQKYYDELMDGLDERIEIMWTGKRVCSRLSEGAYQRFDELTGGRKPFFWMNWPVTDYNPTYLLLGSSEVLDVKTQGGTVPFSGVVMNPMQYAELSKMSIFGVGDYCWNVDAFDVERNYADSFKYIESGDPHSLHVISDQLCNTSGKIGDAFFKESREIRPYIDRFFAAYGSDSFEQAAVNLSRQFDVIIAACDNYERKADNTALLQTLLPWLSALRKLSVSAQGYLDVLVDAKNSDVAALVEKYNAAKAEYDSISECVCPVLKSWTGTPLYEPVHISPQCLMPFMNRLISLVIEDVAVPLGIPTGVTSKGFGKLYGGTGPLENVFDGNPDTYVWFEGRPEDGSFVRIDLGEVVDLDSLRVLSGKPASAGGGDVMKGFVEYSTDGVNHTKLGDLTGADTAFSLPQAVKARYIRIVSNGATSWAALTEVYVNDLKGLDKVISLDNFGSAYKNTSPYSILDGDKSTYAWFTRPAEAGGNLTVDFLKPFKLDKLRVLTGTGDPKEGNNDTVVGRVEYSVNGTDYTEIGDLTGTDTALSLDQAADARFIRIVNTGTAHYMAIRELYINSFGDLAVSDIKVHEFGSLYGGAPISIADGDENTYAWFSRPATSGGYIEIDYGENKSISSITVLAGTTKENEGWQDGLAGHIEYSTDGETFTALDGGTLDGRSRENVIALDAPIEARYIRLVNDGTAHYIAIREVILNA